MEEQRIPQVNSSSSQPDGPEKEPSGGWRSVLRNLLDSLLRPAPLIAVGLALVLSVLLFFFFQTAPSLDASISIPPAPSLVRGEAVTVATETYPTGSIEARVRSVDLALVAVLNQLGSDPASIEFVDVRRENRNGEEFTVQTLKMSSQISAKSLLETLDAELRDPETSILIGKRGELLVIIDGVTTHRFLGASPPFLPSSKGPKVVVVIDDMGENLTVARDLAALRMPITFAVWPNSSHAAEVRALAVKNNLDVLVHLPMEPLGYPKDHPGKQALFVSMSDEQLNEVIAANLAKVPEAVGVNNHMGSRFTGDLRGMGQLMKLLKKRQLFFLDSRTTAKSVGRAAARAEQLAYYGRDIFLDNSLSVPDITLQLKKTEQLARRNGVAVAIGHPHPETVQALRSWLQGLDPSISVVRLTALSPQ